jgi:hypothetical protein
MAFCPVPLATEGRRRQSDDRYHNCAADTETDRRISALLIFVKLCLCHHVTLAFSTLKPRPAAPAAAAQTIARARIEHGYRRITAFGAIDLRRRRCCCIALQAQRNGHRPEMFAQDGRRRAGTPPVDAMNRIDIHLAQFDRAAAESAMRPGCIVSARSFLLGMLFRKNVTRLAADATLRVPIMLHPGRC